MTRTYFVGGNFKMTGSRAAIDQIVGHLAKADLDPNAEVVIAPTSLYIFQAKSILEAAGNKQIKVAAQNVYHEKPGAHTGEISVEQLKQDGVDWVILGHSERRQAGETDETVATKVKAALAGGLSVILCIGESADERRDNLTEKVCARQLEAVVNAGAKNWKNIVVAYEPIWAIGAKALRAATPQEAQDTHAALRKWLASAGLEGNAAEETRILYGGSVTAENCKELISQADIDGFLVGGASLKPAFVDIINATRK
ncbi:triosephosphate isomerase [Peziza echinospora]|nr:triosephosphate isomerase [Peziza echinospora]